MAKIRVDASTFKTLVKHISAINEAEEDTDIDALDKVDDKALAVSRAEAELLDKFPVAYRPGGRVLTPEEKDAWDTASIKYTALTGRKAPTVDQAYERKKSMALDDMLASYKTDARRPTVSSTGGAHALKSAPEVRPITKGYTGPDQQAPFLQHIRPKVVPREELKKKAPRAEASMPYDGEVTERKGIYVLTPSDPSARIMVWTSRNRREEDVYEPPRAWRTLDEVPMATRERIGYTDKRDRGSWASGETKKVSYAKPVEFNEEEVGNDIRFRGGAGGQYDIDVMGSVPGAAGPGGLPSPEAVSALKAAKINARSKLTNPKALTKNELISMYNATMHHRKSSIDSALNRKLDSYLDDIRREFTRRGIVVQAKK